MNRGKRAAGAAYPPLAPASGSRLRSSGAPRFPATITVCSCARRRSCSPRRRGSSSWCGATTPPRLDRPPTAALLRRPLSVSRLRAPDQLELLLRVRGTGGRILARKRVGEMLDVIGPLGHGFELPQDMKLAVIVAGGIGLAPVPFLAETLVTRGVRTIILAGATADERLPFAVERSARGVAVPELEALGAEVEYSSEAIEGARVGALLEARLAEFRAGRCLLLRHRAPRHDASCCDHYGGASAPAGVARGAHGLRRGRLPLLCGAHPHRPRHRVPDLLPGGPRVLRLAGRLGATRGSP